MLGRASFPRRFGLRAESSQRLAIRLERARRSVSLVRKVTQEFLDKTVFCCPVPAAFVILRGASNSRVIVVLMVLCLGNNSQRFLDFARNDNSKCYSGFSTV
jgi:hypothetical protein